MKDPGGQGGGKQRVRDLLRRRMRSHGSPVVLRTLPPPQQPTLCPRCGAVYRNKTWRRSSARPARGLTGQPARTICPACAQVAEGCYRGRVLLRGALVTTEEEAVRRRIANVATRARFTQPERRVVSIHREGDGLELRTTSEKLAHRIVHELEKAFGGRASYVWSHRERSLLAVWNSDTREPGSDRKGRKS